MTDALAAQSRRLRKRVLTGSAPLADAHARA